MARVTERNTRRAINRILDEIRLTARDTVLSRRQAIGESFERITMQFAVASNSVVSQGKTLNQQQRFQLETLATATISRARDIYASGGVDALTMVEFIEAALRGVHVGVIARAFGPEAAVKADDDFVLRLAGLEQDVEREIAELRRGHLSIAALSSQAASLALQSLSEFLDAAVLQDVPGDEARDDLMLLFLGSDIDYVKYGLSRPDVTPLRALPFAAVVLAVSEIYNATREGTSIGLSKLGLVKTGKWTISGIHSTLSSSPDVCDDFSVRELGFGPGRFLVSSWPNAPHPHCGCYMSDVRLTELRQWLSGWA